TCMAQRRCAPLPPTVAVRLREHRARQAAERLRAERWVDEWGLVFTTPSGVPLNPRVMLAAFQRKLSEAGLPKVRFHDLRDALSSLVQAGGISPKVVQEQLGHADLSMTLRYTQALPGLAEAAARRMEEVLADAQHPEDGCQNDHQARAETE